MTPREEAKILKENMGLVYSAVKRRNISGAGFDDAVQVGCLGALKAIRSFDPTRGTKLSSWIFNQAWGDIGHWLSIETRIRTGRAYKMLSGGEGNDAAHWYPRKIGERSGVTGTGDDLIDYAYSWLDSDGAIGAPLAEHPSATADAAVHGREIQAAFAQTLAGASTDLKLTADSMLAGESTAEHAKKIGKSSDTARRRRQALCQFLEPLRDQLDLN